MVREILGLKAKRVDGFALRVERSDKSPLTMNLQNIYAEAQQLDGDARAERLRITPSPHHTDADIEHLVKALAEIWAEVGLAKAA